MNAQVFYRTFNRVAGRSRAQVVDVVVPAAATLQDMVAAAARICGRRLLARSGRTGVFEVQTDAGLWTTPDEGGCVLTQRAQFQTWEQLDEAVSPYATGSDEAQQAETVGSNTMSKSTKKTTAAKSKSPAKKATTVGRAKGASPKPVIAELWKAGWTNTQIAKELDTTFQSVRYWGKGGGTTDEKIALLKALLGKKVPAEAAPKEPKAAKTKPVKLTKADKKQFAAMVEATAPVKVPTVKLPAANLSDKELERAAEAAAEAAHKASGKKGRVIDVVATGSLKAPSQVQASPKAVVAPFVDDRQLSLPLEMVLGYEGMSKAMHDSLSGLAAGSRVQLQLVSITVPFASKQ